MKEDVCATIQIRKKDELVLKHLKSLLSSQLYLFIPLYPTGSSSIEALQSAYLL